MDGDHGAIRLGWLPVLAFALAVVAVQMGQAFLRPLELATGASSSEAPGHLWGLWVATEGFWSCGPLVRCAADVGFPEGFKAHLMDPVNLLLFVPGYVLGGGGATGAVLGWNLLHAAAALVGGWGCWLLADSLWPARPARDLRVGLGLVLAGGVVASPYFLAEAWLGRSEYLPAVLLPAHLALVIRIQRGRGGPMTMVGAGTLLGLVALGGGYLAFFAALLVVPVYLALLWTTPRRRALAWRLGGIVLLAGLLGLPWLLALVHHPPGILPPLLTPPVDQVDLLGMEQLRHLVRVGPPLNDYRPELPVYPGWVLLLLGVAGSALAPRRALPWFVLGLALVVVALGPARLDLGSFSAELPVYHVRRVLRLLGHVKAWSRMGCVLPIPFAIAAAHGVVALLDLRPGWSGGRWRVLVACGAVTGLLVLDQATAPRLWTFERPVFEARPPGGTRTLLDGIPAGALLQAPMEVSLRHDIPFEAGFYLLWQLQHRRPVPTTPDVVMDASLRHSYLARVLLNRQAEVLGWPEPVEGPLPPGASGTLDRAQAACVRRDVLDLSAQGYAGLLVLEDRPTGEALVAMTTDLLGAPAGRHGAAVLWDLGEVPFHVPGGDLRATPCALPRLADVAERRLRVLSGGGQDQRRPGGS